MSRVLNNAEPIGIFLLLLYATREYVGATVVRPREVVADAFRALKSANKCG